VNNSLAACNQNTAIGEPVYRRTGCTRFWEAYAMPVFPLIVFDVNETLLDLQTMEPTFERIFGDKKEMRLWFANLVMYSLALTLGGSYVPFTDIGA
jgi:hypothetical protein